MGERYKTTEKVMIIRSSERSGKAEFLDKTHYVAREKPTIGTTQFSGYQKGDLLEIDIEVTQSGRRMIKDIRRLGKDERPRSTKSEVKSSFSSQGGWFGGIYFPEEISKLLATADVLAEDEPINILFVGPSGYGKTTYGQAFAQTTGREFYRVNCSAVRDPEEWFGYREARDGNTIFETTKFTRLVEKGRAVIILDEFNRVEPWVHDTLFPLLDDDRETEIHGRRITCGEDLIFVATLNEGVEFTGTFSLDRALRNRMDANVTVGPLPIEVEIKLLTKRYEIDEDAAGNIINVLDHFRHDSNINGSADFSTRTALKAARLVSAGLSIRDAFEYVVSCESTRDQSRITDYLNSQLGSR